MNSSASPRANTLSVAQVLFRRAAALPGGRLRYLTGGGRPAHSAPSGGQLRAVAAHTCCHRCCPHQAFVIAVHTQVPPVEIFYGQDLSELKCLSHLLPV